MATYEETSRALTKRINQIYKNAKVELKETLKGLIDRFEKQSSGIREKLDAGEISESDAKTKLVTLFNQTSWDQYIDEMTEGLYQANKQAKDEINAGIADAFADGMNQEAYELERDMNEDIGLVPWDAEDVETWMEENPNVYTVGTLDEAKDRQWNGNNLRNTLITSLLVGIATYKAADYVTDTVINRNKNTMQQNQYNTLSGAYECGRQTSMNAANDRGVKVQKEWEATLDFKTRDAHRRLDGQRVDENKPFEIDGEIIRFPRDPLAPAYLRCNCRCAVRHYNPHWPSEGWRRENIKNEDGEKPMIEYMTYSEWYEMKKQQLGEETIQEQVKQMKREQNQRYYRKKKRQQKQEQGS